VSCLNSSPSGHYFSGNREGGSLPELLEEHLWDLVSIHLNQATLDKQHNVLMVCPRGNIYQNVFLFRHNIALDGWMDG
jgi:hypothetical protein